MRTRIAAATACLFAAGAAFAQPLPGNGDAAGTAPAAAPESGFTLQLMAPGGFRTDVQAFPAEAFAYAPLWRSGRLGGLGLRILDGAALTGDFADDEISQGQSGRGAGSMLFGTSDRAADQAFGGVSGEWRYRWNSNGQFSLSAQHSRMRYLQDALRGYDRNLSLAGAGWLQTFDAGRRAFVYAGVFGGQDRAGESRGEADRTVGGLRIAANWGPTERTDLFAYASASSGRYDRPAAGYLLQRRDLHYDAGIGLNWRFGANWSLRPQFTFTRNDSNIELYDYNRYDLSVTLRRDFR